MIREELITRGERLLASPGRPIRFTGIEVVDQLLNDLERHPHVFVLGCVMDRQIRAERAWAIPYQVMQRVESYELGALASVSATRFEEIFVDAKLHRFPVVMARNFHAAVQRISQVYDGDASRIWSGTPKSATLVRRFLEFDGVGPKIATMAANILVRDFKVPVGDKISIDVSADVQVRRVFWRLGLIRKDATPEEAVYRARELNPLYPGVFDLAAWEIGRNWCRPVEPVCSKCYLETMCPTGQAGS